MALCCRDGSDFPQPPLDDVTILAQQLLRTPYKTIALWRSCKNSSDVRETNAKHTTLCLHAGYAEFALQASIVGCMAMVGSLAHCVAAPGRHHSKPPISRYALVGPEQTSIIDSKLAEASSLRHRARTNGKLRQVSEETSAVPALKRCKGASTPQSLGVRATRMQEGSLKLSTTCKQAHILTTCEYQISLQSKHAGTKMV